LHTQPVQSRESEKPVRRNKAEEISLEADRKESKTMENKSKTMRENERELISMIRNSPDPIKALTIATEVLAAFLKCERNAKNER
jgi:hypothetical protein